MNINIKFKKYLRILIGDVKFAILFLFFYFSIPVTNAAWQAPAGNPYTGNDTFSYIINSEGINDYYILNKPFGLDNAFSVNTNALYIDEINNRTGIATNNPQVTLDVWGTVKFFNTNTLPTCDSSVSGAIIFNTNQDRLNVCVNSAWRRIGHDGDLDHYLDYADCNDNDPLINQGMTELCGNSLDENCDGSLTVGCVTCYRDADGDGYGNPSISGSYNTCPGIGDYVSNNLDCNDNDSTKAVEICGDTITNDCDADINEGCTCTVNDWLSLTCPDMTGCDNNTSVTAIKIPGSLCFGTAPTLTCNCVCRLEHFIAPVPPTCPVCRASVVTLYSAKVSGVTCVDSNSLSDTYCSDNCTAYCNGNTCCNQSEYYYCSGNMAMYHDSCGVNIIKETCTFGCTSGSCNPDPCGIKNTKAKCEACGCAWDEWYINENNKGALCVCAN